MDNISMTLENNFVDYYNLNLHLKGVKFVACQSLRLNFNYSLSQV